MNVSDFHKYIDQPDLLNASTVAELQEVLDAYPYFQAAHFLYLKSLYNQNNFKFNQQLKFSSVHINNRKKLLLYLKNQTKPAEQLDHGKPLVDVPVEKITKPEIKVETIEEVVDRSVKKEKQIKVTVDNQSLETKSPVELPVKKRTIGNDFKSENNAAELELQTKKKQQSGDIQQVKKVKEQEEVKPLISTKKESPDKISRKEGENKKANELSPLEIIKNRIEQIKKNEKKVTSVPDKIVDNQINVGISESSKPEAIEKIKPILVKPIKEKKVVKLEVEAKVQPIIPKDEFIEESDDLVDLSEIIQIEAPSQYFLQQGDEIEEEIEFSANNNNKKHSFSDWLNKISSLKPEPVKKIYKKKTSPNIRNIDNSSLIDSFLKSSKSKQIKASSKTEKEQATITKIPNQESQASFITETLAEIYIKQGYYDKAIESYHKLSLKYPKKNTYFASQIEKVKKLKINS